MRNNPALIVCIYLAAAFCILLGGLVTIGWYSHSYLIVQMRPEFSPMQINSSLSFILAGCSLIFLMRDQYKWTQITAGLILAISIITLLEYIFDANLGIDELFIKSFIVPSGHSPGRMAINTAISFLCAGFSLLLLTFSYNKNRTLANLICTFIILSLGIFSTLAYIFDITTQQGLSQWVRMALHSAAGVIVLSIGLILAMYVKKKNKQYFPILPLIASFSILIATFFGWQIIKKNQEIYLSQLIFLKAENIKNIIEVSVQERATAFSRITSRWMHRTSTPESEWRADVMNYIKDQIGYKSIMLVDKNYRIQWVAPESKNASIVGYNFYQDVSSREQILLSIKNKAPQLTNQIDLLEGGKGIILFSPIFKKDIFNGFMVGVIDNNIMLNAIIKKNLLEGYGLRITDENELLYSNHTSDYRFYNNWSASTNIKLLGQTWRIVLWPTTETHSQIITSWQPALTLLIGVFISLLSGLLVQTLQLRQIGANKLIAARLELANAHERLSGIIEGSEDLIAAIDLNYNFIVFNTMYKSEIYRLFKIHLEVGMNLKTVLSKLSDENRNKTLQLWNKALQGSSFTVIESFFDNRIGTLDYEIHFNPIRDASGNLIGANHIATDVKPRLQNEKKLAESKNQLEKVVSNLEKQNHELVLLEELMGLLQSCISVDNVMESVEIYIKTILKNTSGIIYLTSTSNTDLLEEQIRWGKPISNTDYFKRIDCWALLRNQAHTVNNTDEGAICNHLKAAALKPDSYVCLPLHAQNEIMGSLYLELQENSQSNQRLIYLAHIISEQIALSVYNIKLRDELKSQSTHDTLTGLYNRRFFEEYVNKEMHQRKNQKVNTFGLLLIDVDFFKAINDNHGHLVGDKVLCKISDTLSENCRQGDLVSRWGGEEFMVYLPEISKQNTLVRAEEIRTAIQNLSVKTPDGMGLPVTVSIGTAFYPEDGKGLDELTLRADKALYKAKDAGRNRVF